MAPRRIIGPFPLLLVSLALILSGVTTTGTAQATDAWYVPAADPLATSPSGQATSTQTDEPEQSAAAAETGDKAQNGGKDELDMLEMSPKQLSEVTVKAPTASPAMNAEVSTVSRTESTVGRSPAAVYVLTNEMIRRSGARNIPEALRLVPGVNVAQVNQYTWAVSIRGFNAAFANKLLVQIDGRAVYTPGNGGVDWDQQQVLLEDIERIEVIRGPGGAIWGANAVNGVINIVTKSSIDTKGIYAYSGGGSPHRSFNALRVGGQEGDLHWRVYGMQADDGPGDWVNPLPLGPTDAWDAWQFGQGGFHMDWTPTSRDTLTLQGDFLTARETYQISDLVSYLREPRDVNATNFLGRWTRTLDDDRDWAVQMYYDNYNRNIAGSGPQELNMNTFDLDTQYHARIDERHDVVCGFGYRNYASAAVFEGFLTFDPPRDSFDIISYFIQDTVELRHDLLFLTAGIKLEHNTFTDFEYQPTIRLLVTPDDRTAMWGAVSRAVRTPAVHERDVDFFFGFIEGNKEVRSEDVLAYELGIRRQPTDKLYWDLAVFFNRYDNLVGVAPLVPPQIVSNVGRGDTYGYELAATYEMSAAWRLRGCYSFLVEDIDYAPDSAAYLILPGLNPRNQFSLQSGWDLPQDTNLDMIFRYVDNLAAGVPHYLVMDVRLARTFSNGLEAAVVGQNLFDSHHLEFIDNTGFATEVPSGVYGILTWRY